MTAAGVTDVGSTDPFAVARQCAIGTETVLAVTETRLIEQAAGIMAAELDAVDRACSRFRPDAEIAALESRAGKWCELSPMLFEALQRALKTASDTGGAVDPTVGAAMDRIGYDRDFKTVNPDGPPTPAPVPAPGYRLVELDFDSRRARVPNGIHLDLGATAKALVADRIAAAVAKLGSGVVVSVGGDISMDGPAPEAGWSIGVGADSGTPDAVEEVVAMSSGGLATSSTALRSWRRGARRVHHVIDPATGDCAMAVWQTVTVAGSCCVEANGAATAAMVWGLDATDRLRAAGMAARLVRYDGVIVTTPGWPEP